VRISPRIQQASICLLEVFGVSRHQRQSMNNGGSSDHCISDGARMWHMQPGDCLDRYGNGVVKSSIYAPNEKS